MPRSRTHQLSRPRDPGGARVTEPGPGSAHRGRPARGPGRHHPVPPPAPPPDTRLAVRPWPDPVLDTMGHDPRSLYVERFWLPVLGPSALLLIRRLAHDLEAEPTGFELQADEWAEELGLGIRVGQRGPFWRSIDRLIRFKLARPGDAGLLVHRRIPPLSSRQVHRLPERLQAAHRAWQAEQQELPRRRTISHWSDHRAYQPGPTPEGDGPPDPPGSAGGAGGADPGSGSPPGQ